MNQLSDPALELAQLCAELERPSKERGDMFLSEHFSVEPWSTDFYSAMSTVTERVAVIEAILVTEGVPDLTLSSARESFDSVRAAFARESLSTPWKDLGGPKLRMPKHTLATLSPVVSRHHGYVVPDEVARAELSAMCITLLDWLNDRQLNERDFIRQCLIDGLRRFLFRIERIKWFGWGYCANSLRDVLAAHLMLERGLDPISNPQAGAALTMISDILKKVADVTSRAKGSAETGEWIVSVAKIAWGVGVPAATYVAGLLSHG